MRREGEFDPGDAGDGHRDDAAQPRTTTGIGPQQILIGLLVVILVVFAIANFDRVRVNFLVFDTEARLITVIAVAGGLGFVIGWLVGRPSRRARRMLRRRELDD
jgi:uncharacterized integral membrane protein